MTAEIGPCLWRAWKGHKLFMAEEHLAGPPPTEESHSPQEKDPSAKTQEIKEGKDFWEKFSSLSTFLSTILVALVGGFFTYTFNHREAEHQRNIQETQTVAQLMPYLTSIDQNTRRTAFIAVKVLQDAKLMTDLAASDPSSRGAHEALRDVAFHADKVDDRNVALNALREIEFVPACALPFDTIKQVHEIDTSCKSAAGAASSGPQATQNEVKNNFCATGNPVNLNFGNFAQLQQAAESAGIPFGTDSSLPQDRTRLRNLLAVPNQGRVGEGSLVRLSAFVIESHYSNLNNGESVNCKKPGIENNDIHVNLGQNSNDDPCTTVTAEISPHFRPVVWNPDNLKNNDAHLFRFTGQLFFDASHRPCVGGASGPEPKRISIWEIHPVYAVDICIDRNNNCKVESDQNWVALSDFVGTRTSEQ